jgi:GT2 family glycosyltransferase
MNLTHSTNAELHAECLRKTTECIQLLKTGDQERIDALLLEIQTQLEHCEPGFATRQRALLNRICDQRGVSSPPPPEVPQVRSVDELACEERPGVSLVTCCMNRTENLLKALASWIACPEIHQIVIVDWSSKAPVHADIEAAGLLDPRVLVVRVEGQPRWILSYAYNLGFRIASREHILKTDADIIIRSEFFKTNTLVPGTFLSGDWRVAGEGQEHVNGFFLVRRKDLLSIKGFNEYITTYGWDDDDLYFRLEQRGFNRVRVKTGAIFHIPHGNEQRIDHEGRCSARDELLADPGMKIMSNKFLAAVTPEWGADRFFAPFETSLVSPSLLVCSQKHASWHQVADFVREDANHYGLALALSWTTEFSALFIPKANLRALLEARASRDEISRWDVRLASISLQPVDWHPRLALLRFAEEVPAADRSAILAKAVPLVASHGATLLLDPVDFALAPAQKPIGGFKSLLSVPAAFQTSDIPLHACSTPDEAAKAIAAEQCVMIVLHSAEVAGWKSGKSPAKLPRRPRLILDAQHGLGNRLRAWGSAAAIAQSTGRDLIVVWTPDHHCDCRAADLFEFSGDVVSNIAELDLDIADRATYMEIESGAAKDAPLALNPDRDFYIRSAYVLNHPASTWDSENAFLRALRPAKEVMEIVESVEAHGRLGVHVRFEGAQGTDTNSYDSAINWTAEEHVELLDWREKSHPERFIARIDALSSTQPDLKIFLAADQSAIYDLFRVRYPQRLSFIARPLYDRSLGQLRYALADALLLSRCSHLLGSTWSSFTELARRFSTTLEKVEMSGVDF